MKASGTEKRMEQGTKDECSEVSQDPRNTYTTEPTHL